MAVGFILRTFAASSIVRKLASSACFSLCTFAIAVIISERVSLVKHYFRKTFTKEYQNDTKKILKKYQKDLINLLINQH